MNIREAKEQIRKAVIAYQKRDVSGKLQIPVERQRPVFLIGAPGIGKTAIVSQVAAELGIGFISYSMTHHTRQSALGLPMIRERAYGGETVSVTEYTMSEIIAAIYEEMERSGLEQGILFLDEINCVSETLIPAMLQFLQFKVFGQHRVPEGWVVVTAGNPPEYNQSVREFDMVTWDRVKRIDVEADFGTWRDWAINAGTHPAVLSYLELRPEDLYHAEMTASGRRFVTPRSWVDLSEMMTVLEGCGEETDLLLIGQYLQNDAVARRFSDYLELYRRQQVHVEVREILEGHYEEDSALVREASFRTIDERFTLVGILLDALRTELGEVMQERQALKERKEAAASREDYERSLSLYQARREAAGNHLENVFRFLEMAYGDAREMLILVTELTAHAASARYLSIYGSEGYERHSKELLFYEREQQLIREVEELPESRN